jgi:hypothetical protein
VGFEAECSDGWNVTRRQVEHDGNYVCIETRITSRAECRPPATEQSRRDYRTAELFMFEHGRWPEPGDGRAWSARQRLIRTNLGAQLSAPPLPLESRSSRSWRRRTAVRALMRFAPARAPVSATTNGAASSEPQPRQRPRERRARSRSPGRLGDDDPDDADPIGRSRGRRGVVPGRVRW